MMKRNDPHEWTIWLTGKRTYVEKFIGTVDEALAHADVMECKVNFIVLKIELIRGKKAI